MRVHRQFDARRFGEAEHSNLGILGYYFYISGWRNGYYVLSKQRKAAEARSHTYRSKLLHQFSPLYRL
jgi:hypothetical protein